MVMQGVEISSPYTRKMLNAIKALAGQGKPTFTAHELADAMGVKITVSFRRRAAELVTEGVLSRFEFWTEKGGRAIGFEVSERMVQMPLPEFPF